MDDRSKRDEPDRRIDIDDPRELQRWAVRLGVTEEQVRLLVEKHGPSATEVEKHVRPLSHGRH